MERDFLRSIFPDVLGNFPIAEELLGGDLDDLHSARSDGIGEQAESDTLAVRDRLAVAYKGLHANVPAALDAYAVLMSAMQEGLSGSLLPVCRALGLSAKQYQHVSEGLNGDGVPGAYIMALLVSRPSCVIPAFQAVFAKLGYDLTPKEQASPKLTANETSAVLSEKVGALQAETTRALSDGVFDETEAKRIQKAVVATEAVLRELKAHARKVGRK